MTRGLPGGRGASIDDEVVGVQNDQFDRLTSAKRKKTTSTKLDNWFRPISTPENFTDNTNESRPIGGK